MYNKEVKKQIYKEANMPKTNMTKKQIHEAGTEELAIRMDALFASTENVEDVSLADAKECVEIDRVLKARLFKALVRAVKK